MVDTNSSVGCFFSLFFHRGIFASASGQLWLHLLAGVKCYRVGACRRFRLGLAFLSSRLFHARHIPTSFHGLPFPWSMLLHASVCIHCISIALTCNFEKPSALSQSNAVCGLCEAQLHANFALQCHRQRAISPLWQACAASCGAALPRAPETDHKTLAL